MSLDSHLITVKKESSLCGVSGHYDMVVTCSCQFEKRLSHGSRESAQTVILYHRLAMVELAAGVNVETEWTRGT